MFTFKADKLNTDEILGEGSHGKIYAYQKNPQDVKWVVKHIHASDTNSLLKILPEIVLGFSCDHPAVLPVRGYHIEKRPGKLPDFEVYIKLPRMKLTLQEKIKERKRSNKPFSEKEIVTTFYTIACGIEYLHKRRIVHGDIKPSNALLDENGAIQLSDAGIAKFIADDETMYTTNDNGGTIQYLAPELLIHGQQIKKKDLYKGDVWSLGVTMLRLCLLENNILNASMPQSKIEEAIRELLQRVESLYSRDLANSLRGLLEYDCAQRDSMDKVRDHLENSYCEILGQDLILSLSPSPKVVAAQDLENEKEENKKLLEIIQNLELQNKELLIASKRNGYDTIQTLEKQIMDLVLEHSKATDKIQKEIQELNEVVNALRQEKSELQEHQYLSRSMEKMKQSEENLFQKMFSFIEPDFARERKSFLGFGSPLEHYNSTLEMLSHKLEKTWKNQFQIKHERLFRIIRTQPQKDTITDATIGQLLMDLLVRLDEFQIKTIYGIMFGFNECSNISDEGIKALGSHIDDNMTALQSIVLDLASTSITESGFNDFMILFSNNLRNLQSLELNLNATALSDDGLTNIAQTICRNLQTLVQLHLYFARCGISNRGISNLTILIGKHLKNLHSLKLVLSRTQITDNGALNLGIAICNNLKNLHFLHLYFNSTSISDESLSILGPLIASNLKILQHLELSFNGCSKITDEGIDRLGASFEEKLKTLKHFYIYMSSTQVTDVGIQSLGNSISKHLQGLDNLELGLSGCAKLSNECLNSLSQSICSSLKNLKRLCLYFTDTQISDMGAKVLADAIKKNLKSLQQLKLAFDGSKITEETKTLIKQDLSHIANLTIL